MKALGISGSPRADGNTVLITNLALRAMAEEGVETEFISRAGLTVLSCTACTACLKEERCVIEDDLMPIYDKLKAAGGIILATPVHFGSATALIKGLMERAGYAIRNDGSSCRGKVGGPLVVGRRGGLTFTMAQMPCCFQTMEFCVAGVAHWTIGVGNDRGGSGGRQGRDGRRMELRQEPRLDDEGGARLAAEGTSPHDTAGRFEVRACDSHMPSLAGSRGRLSLR